MEEIVAVAKAFALEGAFHFVELTFEAVRRNGLGVLRPEVLPFRSMPLCESVAASAAAVALVFDVPQAWGVFDLALTAHIATYLWVETGIDAVAVAVLLFMVPSVSQYALCACLLMVALLMLQPRRSVPIALWLHALFMCFLASARLLSLSVVAQPVLATVCLGAGVEIACEALRRRMYGPYLSAPAYIGFGLEMALWMVTGVQFVDAAEWLKWTPTIHSGLPEELRGARFFCDSKLIRGVRFHTGRVVDDDAVAISIGEWDEIAFAPNAMGFVLALLASLRIPMSLRASVDEAASGARAIGATRLVLFFYELPSSVWLALTEGYAQTSDACMIRGALLLLPTRLTLRRITEALLSWILLRNGMQNGVGS